MVLTIFLEVQVQGRKARTIGGVLSWGGVRKREEMGTWRDLNPAVRLQLLTNK